MVSTAARVGSINVLLQVGHGQATASLNAFAAGVERTGARVATSTRNMDRSMLSLNATAARLNAGGFRGLTISALRAGDSITMLTRAAQALVAVSGGLGLALGGTALVQMSDRATRLTNSLRTVTDSTTELKDVQEALFGISQRTRSSFEATATIYSRTARATETLGFSQEKLLRLTETVQKSFAIGGATTAEAQGAAIQLSQGIASDRFSGEEFRSVAENAPVLLRGMAESLGVTIGRLREMAHAGELTARVVTQAIVDASARIDEEFGRTTATIGQAVQYLDNAILKYVQDSSEVSAASRVVVNAIQGVGDNIGGVVDGFLLLGATITAAFAGRRLQAMQGSVVAMKANRLAAVDAAAAQQRLAIATASATKSEWIRQRLAFNKALREGAFTAAQLERQKRALAATTRQYHASVAAAQMATLQHSAALKAATVSSMALSVAGRAVSAAWAFIGGPFGAALLAIGAAMYIAAQRSAEAAERSARYADAIRDAGGASLNSADQIRETARALNEVSQAATEAGVRVRMATAEADLVAFGAQADAAIRSMGSSLEEGVLRELWQQFETGRMTLEEFIAQTDELSDLDPDTAAILDRIQGIARQAVAAIATIDVLKEGLRTLGTDMAPKGDRVGTATFDQRQDEFDFLKNIALRTNPDLFPDIKKPRKPSTRATADDRFDTSIQSIRDRIEALRLERETLNMTLYEQVRREEALKLEQEALKQAREEARRKGEADWQSAQISAAKRAEIDQVTAALAAETVATHEANEALELQKEVLRGVFSDLRSALEDGKLEWSELADVALNALDKIVDKLLNDVLDAIFQVNSSAGGGGGGGILSSIFGAVAGVFAPGVSLPNTAPIPTARASVRHRGGSAGGGGPTRSVHGVNPGLLPRMHSGDGMRHNELMAVLEDTENVLTGRQTSRVANALSASAAIGASAGPSVEVTVINNANNTKVREERGRGADGREMRRIIIDEVKSEMAGGGFDGVMTGRFGASARKVPR